MTQVPTGSHLRTYFSIETMRTSQRHPNIRKPLCILTIPKSKTNLALRMTMTPKNLRKLRPDGSFENTLQHEKPQHVETSPPARKASQCIGFHTARVPTKRCLRTDISVVIIPTLLFRVYCWFGVSLWCHNSLSCILYNVYICLWFRYVCLTCYLLCGALLLIFPLDITSIVLLMCCTTDVSLESPTIYLHFYFVPLTSRFHWKVQCLFWNFCFQKIFNGLRIVTWTWSHWCRSKFYFCNSLTPMLYLPCTKRYYWDIIV